MNVEQSLQRFIGWKLDEARAALEQDESTLAMPLRLVETAAPLRKNQTIEEQAARLGAWRILRAEFVNGEVQLTVAREQLVD